jgi:hypothetical protein
MKPLTRLFLTGAVVAICAGTAWAAEEGTVKMFAPWQSGGQVFRIGPDKLLFQGRAEGIMYIEDGEGALDAALFVCPGSREISLSEKKVIASGRCIVKGSGGGTVFAKFECSGEPGACAGKFTLTGGTERFEGITGGGDIIVRTVLGEMASDLQSGETISGSAGLAIWPSLSYKIPGN